MGKLEYGLGIQGGNLLKRLEVLPNMLWRVLLTSHDTLFSIPRLALKRFSILYSPIYKYNAIFFENAVVFILQYICHSEGLNQ